MSYERGKYERSIHYRHDELPAKYDARADQFYLAKSKDPLPEWKDKDYVKFEPDGIFTRFYDESWNLLRTQTTDLEYKVANRMAFKAKAFNSSLDPLNDDTTMLDLSEHFNVDRRKIKKIVDKLFDLGVYGKFEVSEQDKKYKKYWVFNPYLAFNGKAIDRSIADLFKNTTYAKLYQK